jgi:hypothetical protein
MATKPKVARSSKGGINWTAQIENNLQYCLERLITDGHLQPMFILHTRARVLVIGGVWDNEDEKLRAYAMTELLCIAEAAEGLSFFSEAWMTIAPERYPTETQAEFDARLLAAAGNVETADTRVEAVMVQTMYRDKSGVKVGLHRVREIVRGADGKPRGLRVIGVLPDYEGTQHRGRVYDILPDEAPNPEQRQAAMRILQMSSKAGAVPNHAKDS